MPEPITTTDGVNSCGPCPEGTHCWRLVHAGGDVRALFESGGRTETKDSLFAGTLPECVAAIAADALTVPAAVSDHLPPEARVALGLPERPERKRH